jgi:cell fate (sporulation/competence/biofilm development) regulator YlbF (YheA/YmcA/DUF963 family)
MQSPDPLTPERQAILGALLRIDRRLRLNRRLHTAALLASLALLGLLTWRTLAWLGPAASALAILLAILGAIALVLLIGLRWFARPVTVERAAIEADSRAGLHDTLSSAYWFMREADAGGAESSVAAREWIAAQAARAAALASALQPARIVPLRLPGSVAGGLAVGVVALLVSWSAPRLAPAHPAEAGSPPSAEIEQLRAMRDLADSLPESEAARRLVEALKVLESGAGAQERRRAFAQAQEAVDQIRLSAAAEREGLQKLSQMLAGQQGLEEVAEALARGDAEQAAELLAKAQAGNSAAASDAGEPADVAGERAENDALQQAADAVSEAQGARPSAEALQLTVDRLKEIARELQAANYVNQAWQQVQGPQLQAARADTMAAGRFGEQEQTNAASNPSPATGNTPMGGGTLFRSAAVAQGPGTEESEGGSRMGDAIGDAPPDPLLGEAGERLDAQLRLEGLAGAQGEGADDDAQQWFYTESLRRDARSEWRAVAARARFADAQAGAGQGVSIQHRRIVQDYFKPQGKGRQ